MEQPQEPAQEQLGAVLIFKPGLDRADAEKALEALRELLDYVPSVREFNPQWGSPVWYIP